MNNSRKRSRRPPHNEEPRTLSTQEKILQNLQAILHELGLHRQERYTIYKMQSLGETPLGEPSTVEAATPDDETPPEEAVGDLPPMPGTETTNG